MKSTINRGRPSFVEQEFQSFLTANKKAIKSVGNPAEAYEVYSIWTSNVGNRPMCEASFRKQFRNVKISPDAVEKAKKQSVLSLIEQFEVAREYVKLSHQGIINSLYIYGIPGVGKSYQVESTLQHLGAKYISFSGGIKNTYSLAKALYENRDNKVIIIDDIGKIVKNKEMIDLMKCVMQDNKVRNVSWLDTTHRSKKDSIPGTFVFTSTIILISNDSKLDRAIKSRTVFVEFSANNKEMIEFIHGNFSTFLPYRQNSTVSKKEHEENKEFIYQFIKKNIDRFPIMDFRKFKNVFMAYISFKDRGAKFWEKVAFLSNSTHK